MFLDDLTLEKIEDGPVVKAGIVTDDFSADHIDQGNWVEAAAGRSGYLPTVRSGALIFDNRPMATLVSLSKFDELLSPIGDSRYRLRLHISKGDDERQDALLECGIKRGTVSLTTEDSGLYFVHRFSVFGERRDRILSLSTSAMIKMYWHQDSKFVGGSDFNIKPNDDIREVWYTFYFDRESVTIYADTGGYTENEEDLVGTYEHKVTKIASKGPVFLKMCGTNIKVHDISLMRPASTSGNP